MCHRELQHLFGIKSKDWIRLLYVECVLIEIYRRGGHVHRFLQRDNNLSRIKRKSVDWKFHGCVVLNFYRGRVLKVCRSACTKSTYRHQVFFTNFPVIHGKIKEYNIMMGRNQKYRARHIDEGGVPFIRENRLNRIFLPKAIASW